MHRALLLDERVVVVHETSAERLCKRKHGENRRRDSENPRAGRRAAQRSAHWLKRTATVLVSPALQVTLVTFLPSSALMKMTVCGPGGAE